MVNYLMLAVALILSAIAAFYSIMGLAAIFAAAVIPIVIMGSALEVAKLVCASWVYRNWGSAPATIKYYLTAAVVILMFITSMGTFGYLSKAHIDQTFSTSDNSVIIKNLEREIKSEEQSITTAQRSLDILDRLVSEADPKDANWIRNRQKREREVLNNTIRNSSDKIKTLNTELTPLRQEYLRIEAEVGPLKYVADLIYGESDQRLLEKAVRWVIIVIVAVFDPLAVVMLLAANHGLRNNTIPPSDPIINNVIENNKQSRRKNKKEEEEGEDWHPSLYNKMKKKMPGWVQRVKELKEKRDPSKIEIDKNKIVKMKEL